MEGEHLLDSKGLVQVVINHVDNITLKGETGNFNTDAIIRCSSNTRGLVFNSGNIISIYNVTITECGQQDIPPLLLTNIATIYIHHFKLHNNMYNTSTSNHYDGTEGILYIHMYSIIDAQITITDSVFTNNKVDGGGLLIRSGIDAHSNIMITNSVFIGNMAGGHGGGLYIRLGDSYNNIMIVNCIMSYNRLGVDGHGGGMYIWSTEAHNNITIINSTFNNNRGEGLGCSGLYIQSYTSTYNNITVTNSTFSNNVDHVGNAFGLLIYSEEDVYNNINVANCTFNNNTRAHVVNSHGNGLFIYSMSNTHDNITVTNSTMSNNTDGLSIVSDAFIHESITIHNSIFINNKGAGLVIASRRNIVTLSQVTVSNNIHTGLIAIGYVTVVFSEGHSIIANNSSPTDGGGVYLGIGCHLTTNNGGIVKFYNNTAQRYGGAIYSLDNPYALFEHVQYPYYSFDRCTLYDLSATFINNSAAIAGDQLYGGVFVLCNSSPYELPNLLIIQCTNVPENIKTASSIHSFSSVSSDPVLVCLCDDGIVNCTIASLHREVYPGQSINVSLVTVGLCGGVSPGIIAAQYDKQIELISVTTDYTFAYCTTHNYIVKLTSNISSTLILLNTGKGDAYNIRPINISLSILPCPLGMVANFTSGDCVCNITLGSQVICNISWLPYPIQRSGNNWIYRMHGNDDCIVAHTGCPFDYCKTQPVKFNLNESDLQCDYNRSGILCGQCQPGLSLTIGSNRCANCSDTKAILIAASIVIIAGVAGIILVVLLFALNLTVSVGSINGLLFYVNLVKLNESVFFSQGNIPVISQFISWCNLDMGFEYCFVDGLDGYVKTWLQFVFPVYVWVLVIVIIFACRYSVRLSRLCGHNAVPVLATLILMSYTKLSRTVTNALMMNTVQCGEYKWNVWNVDGNVRYLSVKHTILFIVSLLFLVTGLVYTGLVFSSQWLQRYSGKCCKSTRDPVVHCRLKPLIDAYTSPFKDKYRFWTGLCLIVRLILTVVFSFTTTPQSKLNNYIILLTVGAIIVMILGGRVYKDKRLTVLESFSFINLVCLSVMTILFTDESYHEIASINVIVSVSVSIEIFLFVVITTVHCYLPFQKKIFPNFKLPHFNTCFSSEDEIPLLVASAGDEGGYRREEHTLYM